MAAGAIAGFLGLAGFLMVGETGTAAQQAPPSPEGSQPTFRVAVDLVTTDVIVRDSDTDAFVADLTADEFEVYEDGIRQEIVSLVLTHGGRVFNVQAPPPGSGRGRHHPSARTTHQ